MMMVAEDNLSRTCDNMMLKITRKMTRIQQDNTAVHLIIYNALDNLLLDKPLPGLSSYFASANDRRSDIIQTLLFETKENVYVILYSHTKITSWCTCCSSSAIISGYQDEILTIGTLYKAHDGPLNAIVQTNLIMYFRRTYFWAPYSMSSKMVGK